MRAISAPHSSSHTHVSLALTAVHSASASQRSFCSALVRLRTFSASAVVSLDACRMTMPLSLATDSRFYCAAHWIRGYIVNCRHEYSRGRVPARAWVQAPRLK